MDDFQLILDELDKMESESKARERTRARERRWRAARQRRKRRQKKQFTLLLLLFCGLLALPVSSAISARFRAVRAPEIETRTVSLAQPVDPAPDSGETPENILVGDQSPKSPEVSTLEDMASVSLETDTYALENPENLLPGELQPLTESYVGAPSNAVDYLTENPENYLPGESAAYLSPNAAASASNVKATQKFAPARGPKTITLGQSAEIGSQYAVLLDADTGYIYAERNSDVKVPPASMTKVLTLLVAVEKLIKVTPEGVKGMDTKVTITRPVTNYCYTNNCSIAGFATWETVTVRDLLYGCILPSGADACLALARHISGSQEAFVELMNQKLEQLGISKTAHFTNCIGLYNKDHYCTMRDMAVIMKAAMDHSICRVILNARRFRTMSTAEHPNGISLSNLFLRRIEDRFTSTSLDIMGAKTGYVRQSGNCAVSYASRKDGKNFICVTGKGAGQWGVIADHTLLYRAYCLNG